MLIFTCTWEVKSNVIIAALLQFHPVRPSAKYHSKVSDFGKRNLMIYIYIVNMCTQVMYSSISRLQSMYRVTQKIFCVAFCVAPQILVVMMYSVTTDASQASIVV